MSTVAVPRPLANGRVGWPWDSAESSAVSDPDANWPRITIVTPSFNQGLFLEETIRSVLMQGYPNLEYLILDAGSNDNSLAIIQHYAPHLAGWESAPDNGQADAINRGFAKASGSILAWLNSDDTYLPETLLTIGKLFRQRPDVQLAYGEGWYVNEQSERLEPCRFVRRHISDTYLANRDPILQPAAFWRRELWNGVGPLNTDLNWVFDWEWFIRAHKVAPFHYIPEALANYRIHPAAKTRTGTLDRQLEHAGVTRKYGAWWHPNNVVQQLRRFEHGSRAVTKSWPGFLSSPMNGLSAMPRVIAERVLHGTYMP